MYKWILILFMSIFMTGCVVHTYNQEPGYVWHDGYWYWTGTSYYWVPGHYHYGYGYHPHWHGGYWHHR